METEYTKTHECVDDDGNKHLVDEYQEFKTVQSLNSPPTRVPGIREFRLSSGEPVNYKDENTFHSVRDGKLLHRLTPDG